MGSKVIQMTEKTFICIFPKREDESKINICVGIYLLGKLLILPSAHTTKEMLETQVLKQCRKTCYGDLWNLLDAFITQNGFHEINSTP